MPNSSPDNLTKNPAGAVVPSMEEIADQMADLHTIEDVNGFVKKLVGPTIQAILDAELTHHLGYAKHDHDHEPTGNARNGSSKKTLKTAQGPIELQIPRDREGTFEPTIVPKGETRVTNDIEGRIINMYGLGMTTRDIERHMRDIYGVNISPAMVSMITDKVEPLIREWRERPLKSFYPIIFLDGIHFNVRDNGKIVNKCAYSVLAYTMEGKKDLLGLWVLDSEGSTSWAGVLNELKNRGVNDVLLCCTDGLKGFKEAVKTVFPDTNLQRCIVHLIRNLMQFVSAKKRAKFCADLKNIYMAATEEAGFNALQDMKQKWPEYLFALQSWEKDWADFSTFFIFSSKVRKIIYTTNSVESVHRQFRKITKTTSVFPTDESLIKLLWLGQREFAKRWNTSSIPGWTEIISELALLFPDRMKFNP